MEARRSGFIPTGLQQREIVGMNPDLQVQHGLYRFA